MSQRGDDPSTPNPACSAIGRRSASVQKYEAVTNGLTRVSFHQAEIGREVGILENSSKNRSRVRKSDASPSQFGIDMHSQARLRTARLTISIVMPYESLYEVMTIPRADASSNRR